jgi:hypothetical protein
LNCDSIEHLGESIFVDAIGGDPVVGHLTYKGTRLA